VLIVFDPVQKNIPMEKFFKAICPTRDLEEAFIDTMRAPYKCQVSGNFLLQPGSAVLQMNTDHMTIPPMRVCTINPKAILRLYWLFSCTRAIKKFIWMAIFYIPSCTIIWHVPVSVQKVFCDGLYPNSKFLCPFTRLTLVCNIFHCFLKITVTPFYMPKYMEPFPFSKPQQIQCPHAWQAIMWF
jgi:hypothetical protein